MVRRWVVVAALTVSGCGPAAPAAAPLRLELTVSKAVNADHYDMRIFGAAVHCSDVLGAPGNFELNAVCSADQEDVASNCVLAHKVFASGDDGHFDAISVGSRSVFVEALSSGAVVGHGCAAVTVTAGGSASTSVTVQ